MQANSSAPALGEGRGEEVSEEEAAMGVASTGKSGDWGGVYSMG